MNVRPRYRPPLTGMDNRIEWLAAGLLAVHWIAAMYLYLKLPDTIPIHFGMDGAPDGWGSKGHLFMLPAVYSVLYALMTVLNRYPWIFNYMEVVTEANHQRLYTRYTRMLRWMKLGMGLLFLYVLLSAARTASRGDAQGFGALFVPAVMGLSLLSVFFSLGWVLKREKASAE